MFDVFISKKKQYLCGMKINDFESEVFFNLSLLNVAQILGLG